MLSNEFSQAQTYNASNIWPLTYGCLVIEPTELHCCNKNLICYSVMIKTQPHLNLAYLATDAFDCWRITVIHSSLSSILLADWNGNKKTDQFTERHLYIFITPSSNHWNIDGISLASLTWWIHLSPAFSMYIHMPPAHSYSL